MQIFRESGASGALMLVDAIDRSVRAQPNSPISLFFPMKATSEAAAGRKNWRAAQAFRAKPLNRIPYRAASNPWRAHLSNLFAASTLGLVDF
jgi:hypothetical protein